MCLDLISIIFSLISIFVLGFLAYYVPSKIFINQIFSTLLMNYQTSEVGIAVKILNDFFKIKCKSSKKNITKEYINQYDKDNKKIKIYNEWENTLHFQRRIVSLYFQQICQLRYSYRFPKLSTNILKKYYCTFNLEILEMIYEIEMNAIPKILNKTIPKNAKLKFNHLLTLYHDSQNWK